MSNILFGLLVLNFLKAGIQEEPKDNTSKKLKITGQKDAITPKSSLPTERKTASLKPAQDSSFCDLSVHIYPLIIYGLTGNIELRVILRSSCFENLPILQYFTLSWDHPEILSVTSHPSFVYLNIYGRPFSLKFLKPFQRGNYPDINVAYKFVRLFPSSNISNVNTFSENNLFLNPTDKNQKFTLREINRLKTINNPFFCRIIKEGSIMECIVN